MKATFQVLHRTGTDKYFLRSQIEGRTPSSQTPFDSLEAAQQAASDAVAKNDPAQLPLRWRELRYDPRDPFPYAYEADVEVQKK